MGRFRPLAWMRRRIPGRFWAYLILQMPDVLLAGGLLWAVHRWAGLPTRWAVVLFVLWVLKDLAMYAALRRTLMPSATGPEALVGARAVADERLAPDGYVRLGAERWRAEALRHERDIAPGTAVIVRATRGLTLLVEPERSVRSRDGMEGSHAGSIGEPGPPGL